MTDLMTDRRVRDVQLVAGSGDAGEPCGRFERAQGIQWRKHHL
jgi:hypothetical protein